MRVSTTRLAHTASHQCLRFEGDCAGQKVTPYVTRGNIGLEEKWHTFVNFSCRDETLSFCRHAKVWDFCIDGPTQTTVVGQVFRLAPFRQQAWVERFEAMEAFVTRVSERTETPYIVIIDAPPADEIVDARAYLKSIESTTTSSMPHHIVAVVLFSSEREYVRTDELHFREAQITNESLDLSPKRYVISPGIPNGGVQRFFDVLFGAYKTTSDAQTRLTISIPSAFRVVDTLGHLQECKNAYDITVGNLQHNLKFSVGNETEWAITVIGEWYETEEDEGATTTIKDASTEHTNAMLGAIVATCDEVGAHAAAYRLMSTDVKAMHGLAYLAIEHCNTSWQTALMRHRQKRGGLEPPLLRPPALPKRTHSAAV